MNVSATAIADLAKALEAGTYDAAPSTLTGGAALQTEDLSPVMNDVTFTEKMFTLQKEIETISCKSTTAQWDRQLSVGDLGGSAAAEGNVGPEETSDFVRATTAMCYYSKVRRTTIASQMVNTVDGVKSPERAAKDAARSLGADIEFDSFRGMEDFSNAGVFDGHPLALPALPSMTGLICQVRQSDFQATTRDQNFAEFGSDDSVVIYAGGPLTQSNIEDLSLRTELNFGEADTLQVDPVVAHNYNKLVFGKERIILAGSPQDSSGGDLARQFVAGGVVKVKSNQFLRGKAKPRKAKDKGPTAPASITLANTAAGTSLAAGVYTYYATTGNELGESPKCASVASASITAGDKITVTINHPGSGTFRFFNVYRTAVGGADGSQRFIGRVMVTAGASSTAFVDLGNKSPGFVTGILIQKDTYNFRELAPFTRIGLARTDLSDPEAFFRFVTLAVVVPRRNALLDNVTGTPV